ncbi:1-phosphatidylinositol 4,5-bisphosphate phosphodiesterase eta-2-like isoform X2 [Pomacea canaliculata]|uniref:1-phosphatidylinositol 4,5-bisphosphate phosphodiesterase eta-2-like isoform X2 n=1 Tax=Pomacea canaliculata TaxID=400727 RepID=UPI000D73A079|nr:1-phosphatidylinositol 4,5-bisphosphate phosphodiesterase eta-2-like isoform X2 [Pomacea canaliculata]
MTLQRKGKQLTMEQLLADFRTQGSHLYKVKSPSKLLQRQFFLDSSNMVLYYTGSRRKGRKTDIPIAKIQEVREGEKDFSKKLNGVDKEMCFGLLLGGSHKVVYLMASHKELRDRWVRALRYAVQMEQLAEQRNEFDKQVRDVFNLADKNGDNALDMDEIMKLLKTLNADIKRKYVQEMFERADTNKTVGRGKPTLDREEFVRFYNMLTRRPELEEVFLKYSRGKGYMVVRDILAFLKEGQRMLDVDEEFCSGLVHHCEPDSACKRQGKLTMLGFKNFLMSEQQFLFNSEHSTVYQDMTRPMTHYFINSSHNTYLAEDQLRGPSRVEMYISALSKGCRCVELDCWDGPDNEPIIYHGYTLTSKILFKDVIKAVKEYGFKASPYPVILSLENHCSMEQQSVMAQHMDRILGDMIWAPDSELTATPTPESLKYKVIIKGKRLPPVKEGIDEDEVSDEDEAAESKNQMDGSNNNNNNNNNNKRRSAIQEANKADKAHKKIKLSPALSQLTSMKSVGFRTVDQAAASAGAFAVFSLGESKVEKLIATSALGLNVVTHKKLIRTYPAGSRTDSSNYNPVPAWNHGCQIVALNFQTGGEPMQLNHGRFRDNGGAGYVLKPNLLLADEMFGIVTGNMDRNLCKVLALTIISGIQIPKPNDSKKGEVIDPFIKIEVHGAPSDNAEYSSKVVTNNGFNPRWYETCTFTIRVPELALVRFVVKDEDPGLDDFVAYYCLPFSSMREGYRHFPLYNIHGHRISHSYIFVHVAISNI